MMACGQLGDNDERLATTLSAISFGRVIEESFQRLRLGCHATRYLSDSILLPAITNTFS